MTTDQPGPRMVAPQYNGVAAWDAVADPRHVLRNLKQNEMLTVLEDNGGDWLKVRLPEGIDGFVRRNTITDFVAAPPPTPAQPSPAPASVPPPAYVAPAPRPAAPAPQPVAYAPPSSGAAQPTANQFATTSKGFLRRLFDFSFKSFITPSIIQWIFVFAIVVAALATLIFIAAAFSQDSSAGIVAFVLSPFLFLIYVIGIRIYLELIIVLFRVEENTRR